MWFFFSFHEGSLLDDRWRQQPGAPCGGSDPGRKPDGYENDPLCFRAQPPPEQTAHVGPVHWRRPPLHFSWELRWDLNAILLHPVTVGIHSSGIFVVLLRMSGSVDENYRSSGKPWVLQPPLSLHHCYSVCTFYTLQSIIRCLSWEISDI